MDCKACNESPAVAHDMCAECNADMLAAHASMDAESPEPQPCMWDGCTALASHPGCGAEDFVLRYCGRHNVGGG